MIQGSSSEEPYKSREVTSTRGCHRDYPLEWVIGPEPKSEPAKKEHRDSLKLASYYQSVLDTDKFENRAALARHLGVSRARVTQVLRRLAPSE